MNVVLFGTGWRAEFFIRISNKLPELLKISAIYTRREGYSREEIPVENDIEKALSHPHDAVIVSSGRLDFFDTILALRERGERIIAETSLLPLSEKELSALEDIEGLVLEQYAYTPLFSSLLAALPLLGKIDQVYLSGLHNHHAAAIARRILSLGFAMPDEYSSIDHSSSIVKTGSRSGLERNDESEGYERKLRLMHFGSKLFINDFSSNQYHSYLMGKRVEIRGERAILTETGIVGVDGNGYPYSSQFVFHRDEEKGNGALSLSHVSLGDRTVFINPYYPVEMNDDEVAIAFMLERYSKGENLYPFKEGVADARLGKLL